MNHLVDLLCLCLLCLTGKTLGDKNEPLIVVEGSDVVLPCSLSTEEDIEFKLFDWKKAAQKDEGLKEVFQYNAGFHYNNGLGGQSEEFKGRVSHFQDELKHGDASIIIRNTKISDSGVYSCYFPRLQTPQTFYIKLDVVGSLKDRSGENIPGAAPKPSVTILEETKDRSLLQCEVHGDPEPEVEWRDSAGNTLPAEKTQVEPIGNLFYITLRTTVTQTDHYRCVATQETISHQVSNEIAVYISVSGLSPGWSFLLLVVVGVVVFNVAIVLALRVLINQGYITLRRKKGTTVITVEEGRDVILPCYLGAKEDLRSKRFLWFKRPEGIGVNKIVFWYDKGVLNNDQSEEVKGQDKQFRGRVEYFPEELKQGNASINIIKTTRADSGVYLCVHLDPQKPQMFFVDLVVVASPQKKKLASVI